MQHNRGLTMVEALVVMVALTILVALLLPMMTRSVSMGPPGHNSTQLRGIHMAMMMYAQGNRSHYPGLDSTGQPAAITVEERYRILLDANYFTPEYLINRNDRESGAKQEWAGRAFTSDHYSYAMLQVPTSGGRHAEWSESLNTDAIVLADRNIGTAANPASVYSNQPIPDTGTLGLPWTQQRHGPEWRGEIVRNDNSLSSEKTHLHDTDYAGHAHVDDHLFEAAGDDDAFLIHSGN